MKRRYLDFLLGIIFIIIIYFIFKVFKIIVTVSENKDYLDSIVNLAATILSGGISAYIAYGVAKYQIDKERAVQQEVSKNVNENRINFLLIELEDNINNLEKVIGGSDFSEIYRHLDSIISVSSWEKLGTEITVSKETIKLTQDAYKQSELLKKWEEEDSDVKQELDSLKTLFVKSKASMVNDIGMRE